MGVEISKQLRQSIQEYAKATNQSSSFVVARLVSLAQAQKKIRQAGRAPITVVEGNSRAGLVRDSFRRLY